MTYEEASKQLYIKKTDIEHVIKLIKMSDTTLPFKESKLLEALEIAIKVLNKKSEITKFKRADNKIIEIE